MAHQYRSFTIVVTTALAILFGGCAQKSVRAKYPEQPAPVEISAEGEPLKTKPLVPSAEESLRQDETQRQKAIEELEKGEKEDTLEEEIKKTRETPGERKARLDKLKEEELESLVYKETERERQVRARGIEIEREEARKKAQKAKERGDTPAMRKARREFAEREKLERERKEEMERAVREANIEGCPEGTVEVNPRGDKFNPFNMLPVTLRVRVVNKGDTPLQFETSFRNYGVIAKNLCANGSMTLIFQLRLEDPMMMQVPIIARTTLDSGRVAEEQRPYYLNKMNGQNNMMRVDNQSWIVDLRNR